jgi:GMP synthase-like glutamine amidotransferase
MPPSLLVVQNDPDKSLGLIGDGLADASIELDQRCSEAPLPDVRAYAGLAVLPGLADPVDETPAVQRARAAIDDALEAEMPILGLCLGGQLLAQALGGSVYECRPEQGFHDVLTAPGASGDPLLGGAPERFSVFHAHAYAFAPPPGAETLLVNDVCVQACRVRNTWAFQCHPEATPEWVTALASAVRGNDGAVRAVTADFFARNGVKPEQLERDLRLAEPVMRDVAAGIASGFAAQLV